MEYKVKMAFAKELAKHFKVELAAASTVILAAGLVVGYAVAKKTV